MRTLEEVLTKEYLAQLQELGMRLSSRMGTDGYSGERRSMAKGTSLEFSDFREYLPGDDLRRVDWNSYARFGKLYVKLFLEEKQAAFHIFLDCSRSMDSGEKFLQAKALAASFLYLAIHGGDRAMLYPFRQGLVSQEEGFSQKNQFLQAVKSLSALEAEQQADLLRAVRQSGNLRRGVSVVITDLMAVEKTEEALKLLLEKKQQVLLLQVLSREELVPKAEGAVRLLDAETGEAIDLELNAAVLAEYEKALQKQAAYWQEFCKRHGAFYLRVAEDMPLLAAVYETMK